MKHGARSGLVGSRRRSLRRERGFKHRGYVHARAQERRSPQGGRGLKLVQPPPVRHLGGRSPQEERGLKRGGHGRARLHLRRSLRRERGLKLPGHHAVRSAYLSPLARGAWVETRRGLTDARGVPVTPRKGGVGETCGKSTAISATSVPQFWRGNHGAARCFVTAFVAVIKCLACPTGGTGSMKLNANLLHHLIYRGATGDDRYG